jgi:hypothetical protein
MPSNAALKRQVVARHPQDRLAYIEGKDEYVTVLESDGGVRSPSRLSGRLRVRLDAVVQAPRVAGVGERGGGEPRCRGDW